MVYSKRAGERERARKIERASPFCPNFYHHNTDVGDEGDGSHVSDADNNIGYKDSNNRKTKLQR